MSSFAEKIKKQKLGDGAAKVVDNVNSENVSENESGEESEEKKDILRDGTESELAIEPGIFYSLTLLEPSYRNGGNSGSFQLFHCLYDALVCKWQFATGWEGTADEKDDDFKKCEFSSWEHEATIGEDYIYCSIQKVDSTKEVAKGKSFFYERMNC